MKNIIILFVSLITLSGCMGVKKAEKVMRNNPTVLAKLSKEYFPVIESEIKIDSIFIKGGTITRIDTVEGNCPDGTIIKTPCPECKESKPDTIRVNKTIKVKDTASEHLLNAEISNLKKDNSKLIDDNIKLSKDSKRWRNTSLICLGFIGLVFLFFALKSKIKKIWL